MSILEFDGWTTIATMQRFGASVDELAKETIESIMGYEGKGGHKPARADIQKMKDVWNLYLDEDPANDPGGLKSKEWKERYELTDRERQLVYQYNRVARDTHDPQKAFSVMVSWLTSDSGGGFVGHEDDAKRYLGQVLKKNEESDYPRLYNTIKRALDGAYWRSTESYKLWPWMVKQIKQKFQADHQSGNAATIGDSIMPGTQHIVDIVTEGGSILSKLRAENKLPQNFDINHMDIDQFEDWLMEWKKTNREANSQGQVVYQFHDGWTIQKLTTPDQLQFEGDEMGHCFHGQTRVLTYDGVVPIQELAGKSVKVLAHGITKDNRAADYGRWVDADFKSFGRQPLMRVTLSRFKSIEILVTPEHRWIVHRIQSKVQRIVTTCELKPGDKILSSHRRRPFFASESPRGLSLSSVGVQHGVAFGDGTASSGGGVRIELFGDKNAELLTWFAPSTRQTATTRSVGGVIVHDLPSFFKELPSLEETPSYLIGWLAGYFAADGNIDTDGRSCLCSASLANLEFAELICQRLGIPTLGILVEHRVGLGTEVSALYRLVIPKGALPAAFYLLSSHRERVGEVTRGRLLHDWTVKSVESTDIVDEVYCAVVPQFENFVLDGNILTGNCVGGYSHAVNDGSVIIYSLRDPKGMPHVTMEMHALEGAPSYGFAEGEEPPEGAIYNHEYIHPDAHTPGEHMEPGVSSREPAYRPTGETPFEVVQVQGNSNKTPKPEYQRKIKEFLDALRAKGWKFVRSEDWFAPFDDPSQSEYGEGAPDTAQKLDEWYDDHYKTHHEAYRGIGDGDAYGLPSERATLGISDWEELFKDCFRSLVYEYDPGKWTGRWQDLAQAVYHAWMIDIYKDRLDPDALEKHRQNLVDEIQSAEQTLHEWNDENWFYVEEHRGDEIAEKIKDEAQKRGELDNIEKALDEQYGEDGWDDRELRDWVQDNDEDLWYAANDSIRDEATDEYAGDAYKFVQYLIYLAEKHGALNPQDLPNPNERNGGLPSFEDLEQMPWRGEVAPTNIGETPVEEGLPGTLSAWRAATNEIQIHPIDNEHNVWFDEDGNQRARYRPGWAKDPETGKMKQTGDLEDTFLDKHGRQGQGWVAYDGENPIGSLTYVDDSGWHMLGTAYVHPNYREQGVFSRLVAPLRETGKPIDAYVWNNPWLKQKVRSWR